MKKLNVAIMAMAFMGMASVANAQSKDEAKEAPSREARVEKRAERLIVELGLDDKDAAKFKEIYTRHALAEKEHGMRGVGRMGHGAPGAVADKKAQGAPEAGADKRTAKTDGEVDAEMKARLAKRVSDAQAESDYYNELRTVLSARQAKKVMEGGRRGMQQGRPGQGFHRQGGMMAQGQRKGFGQHMGQHMGQHPGFGQHMGQHHAAMQGQHPEFGQHAVHQGNGQHAGFGMHQQQDKAKLAQVPQMSEKEMKEAQKEHRKAMKEHRKAMKKHQKEVEKQQKAIKA